MRSPPLPPNPPHSSKLDDEPAAAAAAASFLSIPQADADPAGRARRLSYKTPYWDFVPYSQVLEDPTADQLTTAAPGGALGMAQLVAETEGVGGQIAVSVAEGQKRTLGPMATKCNQVSQGRGCSHHRHGRTSIALTHNTDPSTQIGGGGGSSSGKCLKRLDSYELLYEAVDPKYQPAAFRFWDSDAASRARRPSSDASTPCPKCHSRRPTSWATTPSRGACPCLS